ncbi:hypothetical protein [Pseudomonas putida]|uniref:Uncharacterized protein n=1 Tax=Pseudomonas putida TaxID=303 RepID=A0A177SAQ5_PSEPU|nr:hypothetical protein [Pseudomonas putida]OAI84896.1 hypothetical protein AYO28_03165 [Pseudomonas putida]
MDTNKMREQFEAKFPVPAGVAWKESIGMYEVVDIWKLDQPITISKYNWLWEGWQASRESVVVELPKVVCFEGAYDSHRHHEFVPSMSDVEDADEIFSLCRRVEAKEAIEAQGLKVKP